MNEGADRWIEFLDPELLRPKLIAASIFLAAYELLQDSILDRLASFYAVDFDERRGSDDPTYKQEVLSRNLSRLYASLSWLNDNGVINAKDLADFERVKRCRNRVAHELAGIVGGSVPPDFLEELPALMALLHKIELWWIVNVEVAVNPDFDGKEIDKDLIIPGSIISLQVMLRVALGSDDKASYFIDEFRRGTKKPSGVAE